MSTKEEKCLLCCVLVLLTFDWTFAKNSDANSDELKERIGDELPIATTRRPDPHVTTGDVIFYGRKCNPTHTTMRGVHPCGGETIFEDNFDTLREDVWQIEQYIPVTSHPEHPFVSYINNYAEPLVFVANGSLHITPKILQDISGFDNESIYLGELSLDDESGCTSHGEECYRKASGSEILPPVMSGRITNTQFAFRYGTVHVRAKLPQGDWLYPEILLEPIRKKYGLYDYASGVIKIAAARGNKELKKGADRYDNGVLYGGPIMDVQCQQRLLATRPMDGQWGDDFHDYSLTWAPNYISLSVDGEEWAKIKPTSSSLLARFPSSCTDLPREQLQNGTSMAPFDADFTLTLGVAAGGITEFPDESQSAGARPKPWHGGAHKSMLTFWQDLPNWEKTWNQPRLIIDYIKVVAL